MKNKKIVLSLIVSALLAPRGIILARAEGIEAKALNAQNGITQAAASGQDLAMKMRSEMAGLRNSLMVTRGDIAVEKAQSKMDRFHYDPLTGYCVNSQGIRGFNKVSRDLTSMQNGECGDFHGADLQAFDIGDANLKGANLNGADLRNADLEGAALEGADLRGAKLEGTGLSAARFDKNTRLPFSPEEAAARGMISNVDCGSRNDRPGC